MNEDGSSDGLGEIPTSIEEIVTDTVGEDKSEDPTAKELTFNQISEEGRLDVEIRVKKTIGGFGSKKDARLIVEDVAGDSIPMNIWKAHKVPVDFKEGGWYKLEDARIAIWDDDKKELSSTKDLEVKPQNASFERTPQTSKDPEAKPRDTCPEREPQKDEKDEEGLTTTKISEKDLLDELNRLEDDLDKPPSRNDVEKIGEYSVGAYKHRFGSLKDALNEAGIATWREEYTPEDMLNDIRKVAEDLGRSPSAKDMRIHGKLSPQKYSQVFGSWEQALDEAGLPHWKEDFSESDVVDEIIRISEKLDRVPSKRNMKNYSGLSNYSDQYFESWTDALLAAGYRIQGQQREVIDDEELLKQLTGVSDEESIEEFIKENCEFHPQTYRNRFGSLDKAVKKTKKLSTTNPTSSTSEAIKERLGELVELQPTNFDELSVEWGFESKQEAKKYLRSELDEYYKISSTGITATDKAEKIAKESIQEVDASTDSTTSEDVTNVSSDSESQSEVQDPEGPQNESGNSNESTSSSDLIVERLSTLVELQPTNFDELSVRWNVNTKDEARKYLRSELSDYYEIGSTGIIATEEGEKIADEGTIVPDSANGSETKSSDSKSTAAESTENSTRSGKTEEVTEEGGVTGDEGESSNEGVPTRDNLINDLQEVYSRIDTLPLQSDINEEGNYSSWEYTYEFGSLEDAYEAADINVKRELLDEIEKVADKLGKKPKPSEVTEHGRFSRQRYKTRFRSWSRALEMAETSVNSSSSQDQEKDSNTEDSQEDTTTSQEPTEANDEPSSGGDGILDSMKSFFESD